MTYRHILMGRMMGFEPTNDGATIRCVDHFTTFAMAGAVGIEPTLTVLETGVLPLCCSAGNNQVDEQAGLTQHRWQLSRR